jgi:transposase
MLKCIEQAPLLYKNYKLLVSIKGIAQVNATSMIIHTGNFTRFLNARQYACYAGVAPFGKTSGTSKKSKPSISKIANKDCKVLLTQAAKCACRHNTELREYYNRKIAEGKPAWLVTNNVRNKLITRCFSVIERQEPYQESRKIVS